MNYTEQKETKWIRSKAFKIEKKILKIDNK